MAPMHHAVPTVTIVILAHRQSAVAVKHIPMLMENVRTATVLWRMWQIQYHQIHGFPGSMNRPALTATVILLRKSEPGPHYIGMQPDMADCTVLFAIVAPMRCFHRHKHLIIINLSNIRIVIKQVVAEVFVTTIQKGMMKSTNLLTSMEATIRINPLGAIFATHQFLRQTLPNGLTISSGPLDKQKTNAPISKIMMVFSRQSLFQVPDQSL